LPVLLLGVLFVDPDVVPPAPGVDAPLLAGEPGLPEVPDVPVPVAPLEPFVPGAAEVPVPDALPCPVEPDGWPLAPDVPEGVVAAPGCPAAELPTELEVPLASAPALPLPAPIVAEPGAPVPAPEVVLWEVEPGAVPDGDELSLLLRSQAARAMTASETAITVRAVRSKR